MGQINRRESPRIEIKLRCYVTAPVWMRNAMYTENISRHGLLLVWRGENATPVVPSIGQIVTVEVELPAHHGFEPKCIHCQRAVSRVMAEGSPDGPLVALRLNYMDFRSFQDRVYPVLQAQDVANSWTA